MKSYFRNNNRGQAALEFMMTYGWAILVVLAAIGALSYFGVLNPSRFTPDTCLASAPFSCPGKPVLSAVGGNATLSIINGQGYSINVSNATLVRTGTLADCTGASICTQGVAGCSNNSMIIAAGQGVTIHVTGCSFTGINVVKGDLTFTYKNPESFLTEQILVSVTAKPR